MGLVTTEGDIVKQGIRPFPTRELQDVVSQIAQGVQELVQDAGITLQQVMAVGVCAPGLVDQEHGIVNQAANFPTWSDAPLCKLLSDALGCPAYLENDASAAAIGEWWRASTSQPGGGVKHMALITLGTGVGGGLIVDGKLVAGMGMAGEVGHTIVDISDTARPCGCGQKGCLEQYASAPGIVASAKQALSEHPEAKSQLRPLLESNNLSCDKIFAAALGATDPTERDELAFSVVNRTCHILAQSILNLVRVLDSEIIVIGGGVSDAGAPFISLIQQHVDRMWWDIKRAHKLRIVQAQLGNAAGFMGAAKTALDRAC